MTEMRVNAIEMSRPYDLKQRSLVNTGDISPGIASISEYRRLKDQIRTGEFNMDEVVS